ncbi:hypothetical protein EJ03DRAFT_350100 [Teratosphaeria nubilosa]|uniref:ACB domain-containing protein n=1 Tax=Teratosphaeria nubilosa TaxID=161662 RepID=A0A6G1LDY9_9PEZI|nr:hypothetical protein EJ03DRAFT_350100 [Teratosphaeria nubilosa]
MSDSVDRVFGHALNTVNKIRPGSTKPPSADRLALYGLYKQSMEGDVTLTSDQPTTTTSPSLSSDALRKEQEKWDAWKSNEGISRTEAKRRYIEKLISTMHEYASGTDEARELVEELEFVWDQVKSNSQHNSSGSEISGGSPLQLMERSGYLSSGNGNGGIASSAAALEGPRRTPVSDGRDGRMRVLSPVSQADEDEQRDLDDEGEEFVDAPISQIDVDDHGAHDPHGSSHPILPRPQVAPTDAKWRKRIESSLIKLTTEVAALREQLESRRFFSQQRNYGFWGWVLRLSWLAVQLVMADAVILWIVILYMRRRKDRRLEGAVRVLLGDAVAQAKKVGGQVKMPTLPRYAKKGG